MKAVLCALAIVGSGLGYARAGELAGAWEGKFPRGAETFYAGFDLDVSGDRITGAAFVQGWGYSTVSGGRVEGDRFRFTVDRKFTGTGPASKVEFEGALSGDSMTLAMNDGERYETTLHRAGSQVTGPVMVDAAPKDLQGKWTARFTGRIGNRPKMIGRIDFDFRVDGNTLTGVAHMAGWPGDCPLSEGKVRNGRFSFTATGLTPSSTGIPVMWFEGEMHGNGLKMTMHHQIFGSDTGLKLPLDARRM